MLTFLLQDFNLLAAAIILSCFVILITIVIFWRKLGALIDRLLPRSEPESSPVNQQRSESSSFGVAPNIMPDSRHAKNLAARIVGDMENAPIPLDEKLRLLSVLAANQLLRAEFEAKYRIIFKSQLDALTNLRQRGPHSLDVYYKTFLERVEERKGEVDAIGLRTNFETWVGFLAPPNYPYVEIESGIARITERGDAFMEFTGRTNPINHVL